MFDPVMFVLAAAHLACLCGFFAFIVKRIKVSWQEGLLITPLLVWASLVLGAHTASLFNGLGNLGLYVAATFVVAAVIGGVMPSFAKAEAVAALYVPTPIAFAPIVNPKIRKALYWFLGGTLALFALISLVLGLSVYPDNADSMIYRLPRAVWYVSQGNFLHPFTSIDTRLIFYPLSGVALYVPLILYGLPGTAHAMPSFVAWSGIVYLAYRFARALGSDRLIALFAAWIIGLTPGILAQATSTNDEIIAAFALIAGFYMLWKWATTGQPFYFLLSGLAVALSASTKLHIVFLLPIIAMALLVALVRLRPKADFWRKIWSLTGVQTWVTTFVLVFVIFAPFLIYNMISTGRPYFLDDFKNEVFNLTANIRISLQNLLIYFSQLILSPIADLNMWPVANDRLAFNNKLNAIFGPAIQALLSDDPTHYHLGYRFQGITLPVSVRFVEFSLWSGFIWLLWPLQVRGAMKASGFALRHIFFFIALIPLLWLLLWSFSTLYMEGTATYYTFYLICAAPAAAFALTHIVCKDMNRLRWAVVTFVTLTNLIIAHNLVMFSGFRALPDIYYARTWPYDWLLTPKTIIDEIRGADRIRIAFTHEKMPYFGYMHWTPRATYYTPYQLEEGRVLAEPEKILQLLPISSMMIYGYMPLKIEGKLTPGVTYLGVVRAIGREAIFATGANVQLRHPTESNYIVGRAQATPIGDGSSVFQYSDDVAGLNPEDKLTFEHLLELNGQRVFHRPPEANPAFKVKLAFDPNRMPAMLTTIVRSAYSGKEVSRGSYQVGGGGAWLPEPGDY